MTANRTATRPSPRVEVSEVRLSNGAGFIVAIAGNMMTMPGLPKVAAAEKIDVDADGNITGLFSRLRRCSARMG